MAITWWRQHLTLRTFIRSQTPESPVGTTPKQLSAAAEQRSMYMSTLVHSTASPVTSSETENSITLSFKNKHGAPQTSGHILLYLKSPFQEEILNNINMIQAKTKGKRKRSYASSFPTSNVWNFPHFPSVLSFIHPLHSFTCSPARTQSLCQALGWWARHGILTGWGRGGQEQPHYQLRFLLRTFFKTSSLKLQQFSGSELLTEWGHVVTPETQVQWWHTLSKYHARNLPQGLRGRGCSTEGNFSSGKSLDGNLCRGGSWFQWLMGEKVIRPTFILKGKSRRTSL